MNTKILVVYFKNYLLVTNEYTVQSLRLFSIIKLSIN